MGRPLKHKQQHDDSYDEVFTVENPELDPKNRTVFLFGDINEHSTASTITRLVMLSQVSSLPIRMIISTYGGSIDESLAIYDVMKLLSAPIYTVGIGKIMSAGVLLLAAGEKGHRLIGTRSRIMIHNASMGFLGDAFEIENEYKEFKRLASFEDECLIKETNLTKKELNKILKSRFDHYITPKQAIKFGIADKLTSEE